MAAFFALSFFAFCFLSGASHAYNYKLSPENFYAEKCPDALTKIQEVIKRTVSKDPRMGASLLRLHFHDCFVNGCDASVLLNDTLLKSEQQAPPNKGSLRGFEVIDTIKSEIQSLCDRVVSCADILAVAARDSVVALGGPTWEVQLGRKDSLITNFLGALTDLPAPTSDLSTLILAFGKKNLDYVDMVALSGGHTIGQAKCKNFRDRIYSESNIDSTYARTMKKTCSENDGATDDNLSPFDGTAYVFDNTYFRDLVRERGLLHSDQELFSTETLITKSLVYLIKQTKSLVYRYSNNATAFYDDFTSAMVKMGKLSPPPGSGGEIRKYCWKTNPIV